jgi:mRNA interferase MazF
LSRLVVVVSAQPWLDSQPPVVTVIPFTRTRRERATHVEVQPGQSGLAATSYAKCDDIRAVSPLRLRKRFGSVDPVPMMEVEAMLRRLLGL